MCISRKVFQVFGTNFFYPRAYEKALASFFTDFLLVYERLICRFVREIMFVTHPFLAHVGHLVAGN